MKKFVCFILLSTFFVFSPSVLAQTASPSSIVNQITPSPTPNLMFFKSLSSFMVRLSAATIRADKIGQKIAARSKKLNLSDPQQITLTNHLEKLKTDLKGLNSQSQSLNTSVSSKQDYLLLRRQLVSFTKDLKDVYKLELDLTASMKNAAVVTSSPSSDTVSGQ